MVGIEFDKYVEKGIACAESIGCYRPNRVAEAPWPKMCACVLARVCVHSAMRVVGASGERGDRNANGKRKPDACMEIVSQPKITIQTT